MAATTYCGRPENLTVIKHGGFRSYHFQCVVMAPQHDAAIMAAAVVNWIPASPYVGKMTTKGYKAGDIIQVPFVLAPRVIEDMKQANPNLTLIGCKMLVGSTEDDLIEAAYGVLLRSRCNVVIANDMGHGLKRKLLVYKDRSAHEYDNDFDGFYDALTAVIEDEHFKTVRWTPSNGNVALRTSCSAARKKFDRIVEQYRDRFCPVEGGRVFGAVAVSVKNQGWLVSPREKGEAFTAANATLVSLVDWNKREVRVPEGWNKASLNAPLLIRWAASFMHEAVVHFHDQVEGLPTIPYAPPGTVRDNERTIYDWMEGGFNIEGHGCVLPLKE